MLSPSIAQDRAPRIGLVLSGGGARGAAHVGVLRVLEELRVPVHCVTGTSMGAVVGGLYAYGWGPADLQRLLDRDGLPGWDALLADGPPRSRWAFPRKLDESRFFSRLVLGMKGGQVTLPRGFLTGQNLELELQRAALQAHDLRSFDDLALPFRCVATDLENGAKVVLDHGNLATALRASMSLPGVFDPTVVDGRQLVDGGLVANVPVAEARAMGAEVLIVVDIGTPPAELAAIRDLVAVTSQMVALLIQQNVDRSLETLGADDVLILPQLGDLSSADFARAGEAIAIGETAARAMAERLRRFALPVEAYAEWRRHQRRGPVPSPVVRSLTVHNRTDLDDAVLAAGLSIEPGRPLDLDALRDGIDRLYAWQDLDHLGFTLRDWHDGGVDLAIDADQRSWGVSNLRLGVILQSNFRGDSSFDAIAQLTVRPIDGHGSELRTEAGVGNTNRALVEYYHVLDAGRRFFVAPAADVVQHPEGGFLGGQRVADLVIHEYGAGLEFGANLGSWGELRAGVARRHAYVDVGVTSVPIPNFALDDGFADAQLRVETLDNVRFPRSGMLGIAGWRIALPEFGADQPYQQVDLTWLGSSTFGDLTLTPRVEGHLTTAHQAPIQAQHQLGGFLNLSGTPAHEANDQHTGLLELIAYYRLGGATTGFAVPVYVGGSIEAGSTWARRDEVFGSFRMAGSVFLGLDTPAGPVYLAGGLAEGGESSLYFFVGRFY